MKPTKQPAVFIDRDGTLVEEVNYLSRLEDLRIFPFTAKALQLFKRSGYRVIVVTNQSGIGRQVYSVDDMHSIHREMTSQLPGLIDAYYYCPHLPEAGCACRKPLLGMIENAQRDFEIDLERSWMIGDKKIDVETGINAGVGSALVLTGYGATHRDTLERAPDIVATDLWEAALKIAESAGAVPR